MVDTLTNLQAVYAKWEGTNPYNRDSSPPGRLGNRAPSLQPKHMSSGDYGRMMNSGHDAWKNKYKTRDPSTLPTHRAKSRHNNRGITALSLSDVLKNNVAPFKKTPSVYPAANLRPFTGRCCGCMPQSRSAFYREEYRDNGLKNILLLDTQNGNNSWFTRTFYVYSHVMRKSMKSDFPDVDNVVLQNQRVKDAVTKTVNEQIGTEEQDPVKLTEIIRQQRKKVEAKAKRVVTRMKSGLSSRLIRFTAWFLHKLLGRLLTSIVIHRGQIQIVKQACQHDLPVIFLPTHRSHLDYILITFILFNHGIMAPHVAAGDNLLIPFFGPLMRGLGGFFIRRKLDKQGKKDLVYRAVLQTYMNELLSHNQYMEFFVEGGRTRSGKAIYPKGGLLSVIVDAFNEGIIKDAYIVPISISYDKILDGNFSREQMGEPKQRETFWRAVSAIWAVIMSHYGNVRVDFSQPFSLKEFVQVSQTFQKPLANGILPELAPKCDSPTLPEGIQRLNSSDGSIYGTEIVIEDQRQLIQGLAEHIVFEQNNTLAAMSTHMVALLLLNKHRQGVDFQVLVRDFDWLRQEVTMRGRDLGFTGKTPHVLSHALTLLGDKLVKRESKPKAVAEKSDSTKKDAANSSCEDVDVFLRPAVGLPEVFELSYYANITNSLFVVESVLANALYSLIEKDSWSSLQDEKIMISQQHLMERAEIICCYLKYEYIFTPPCVSLSQTLMDSFDRLTTSEILQRQEGDDGCENTRERDYARRLDKTLSFHVDDDSDEEDWSPPDMFFQVNTEDQYSMSKLKFLRDILGPILETYYIVVCNLVSLIDQDMPEDDFVKRTHSQLKERVKSGVADFAESSSLDSLKNAIRSLQHNKIVSCYQAANIKMIGLKEQYKSEATVCKIVEHFEAYRE